ncbi:MAG: hypothetical protein A2Y45_05180 [Tenericutes bacterium GWC2_34_14]|nr:MAG: hypothetical protein A2Y45_05180 [Tenericutes bacterium GWC2_34_14]OHE33745.1 MAG: hypothetical protein A2012_04630 [Tenericutes bacterium GWE2_34_108]OHE37030.1 MAG: hypothetical protein A2Y46_10430 [Tenericutes bacterium GWF1_35_14]OHE37890.1 MAG: hypothetical protein A2Y44_08235 [Tenericutes bacterium GWF2_35_184]OHE43594.1 MAG: hypothetical protein A2221_07500 [Tenericutes bacterium RIFOXYA2_FULL_36_32]OHE46489.1 MAG: hypothetical protein A2308_04875 [Tenericutes bacterium RIFOXYB2
MKNLQLLLLSLMLIFVITACDPRKELSSNEILKLTDDLKYVILDSSNWETDYIFMYDESYLLVKDNELFYVNVIGDAKQQEINESFSDFKELFTEIFEQYITTASVTGWYDIGSYKTLFFSLSNEDIIYDDVNIKDFACRINSDGSISIQLNYQKNSINKKIIMSLIVDEKTINSLLD